MDVLLLEARSTLVEFYPPERPASATCAFLSPRGVSLLAPAATLDALSRSVSSVDEDDPTLLVVAGVTGSLVEGRRYWHVPTTSGSAADLVRLSEIVTSQEVAFDDPPPSGFSTSDFIVGGRLTATVTAAVTATRDVNYRLQWTVVGHDGVVRIYQQLAHVVLTQYRAAVTASQARAYVADMWSDQVASRRRGFFVGLAERASERVWRRIRASGRFQHLLGDPNDFEAAGRTALDIELLAHQLVPPAVIDRLQYRTELERQLQHEIDEVIGSRPYDADDTKDISDGPTSRPLMAISARRV